MVPADLSHRQTGRIRHGRTPVRREPGLLLRLCRMRIGNNVRMVPGVFCRGNRAVDIDSLTMCITDRRREAQVAGDDILSE